MSDLTPVPLDPEPTYGFPAGLPYDDLYDADGTLVETIAIDDIDGLDAYAVKR